jgi:uncharacterized protein (DUF2141 family)
MKERIKKLRFAGIAALTAIVFMLAGCDQLTNSDDTYSVAIGAFDNGSVTADKPSAEKGDLVTLTVNPHEGYRLAANGLTVKAGGTEVTTTASGNSYTFTMPASNVTVAAVFELLANTYLVTITPPANGSVTANKASAAAGATVTLTVSPDVGYKLKDGSLKVNNDNSPVTAVSGVANSYSFAMPASNVTVTAEFETLPADTYSVTITQPANGSVAADKAYASANDTVTLTVSPAAGYKLKDGSLKANDSPAAAVSGVANSYSFAMPASNVTVTAEFEALSADTYSVTITQPANGSVTADKANAAEGDTVILTVSPTAGYQLAADGLTVKAGGTEVTTTSSGNSYTFTMPASNVTVTAQFTAINYSITISEIANGSVVASVDGTTATTAAAEATVTLTAVPEDGYELESITVTKTDSSTVEVNGEGNTRTFAMPAGSVTVAAAFKAVMVAGSLSGTLSKAGDSYDLGDRDVWLNGGISGVTVKLSKLEGEKDAYTLGKVHELKTSGNSYSFTGIPLGTYRLEAEKGPYDYIHKETVTIGTAPVTENIALAVFPGLKMTVKVDATSPAFILPIESSIGGTIDLNVDWGDGTPPVENLATKPVSTADPNYTHDYTDSLETVAREFTIRMTGICTTSGNLSRIAILFAFSSSGDGGVSRDGDATEYTTGYLLRANRDKIVKAAGNITELSGKDPLADKYGYLFYDCRKLTDISGLVFTDDSYNNTAMTFLQYAFSQSGITTVPASLLPAVSAVGGTYLSHAFEKCLNLETVEYGFLKNLTGQKSFLMSNAFNGCTKLSSINLFSENVAAPTAGAIDGLFENTNPTNKFKDVGKDVAGGVTLRIHSSTVWEPIVALASLDVANIKVIQVPGNLVADYKAHAKWSTAAGKIESL